MGYATAGLICLVPRMGGTGPALWVYTSTDAHGTVEGSLYFSDGDKRGMKVGDVVIVVDSDTGAGNTTIHSVNTVTAGSGATINAALLA